MTAGRDRQVLGILGGMGPLASAEFLRTIYECSLGYHEQKAPIVLMHSDPSFPDRTDAFLSDRSDVVLAQLIPALYGLCEAGATEIVMCCVTLHHLLPKLPNELRERIVSLLDVIYAEQALTQKRHLLVCSSGTWRLGLFQKHPQWRHAAEHIVIPDTDDQKKIHEDIIYPVKRNVEIGALAPLLESLMKKYEVDSFIVGCTEVHLLAKHFMLSSGGGEQTTFDCIDPLIILAKKWAKKSV
ncbi:MAG TPA: amino acid racemase [Pyrinomonadaceae bacterium]|jgi:aspartate racemase